ncbi:MAG TPA: RNA methyltransferase [Blastocatellia bacterium]|nr:RNA methyltransferase [Blastocatellia bacterium]
MLVEKITSRQNPLIKRFRRVRSGSEHHHVFLEGVRLIEDAIEAGARFETVAFTSSLESSDRGLALLDALQSIPCRGAHVSKQVMDAIAETESPQGIAAIISRPHYDLSDVITEDSSLIIIVDQLQDPGNIGTLIRTAEAGGATGLVTTRYTVDPFNHKSLRASMGAAFRLPIATDAAPDSIAERCKEMGITVVASRPPAPKGKPVIEDAALADPVRVYSEVDFTKPLAITLGSEAAGVSKEIASVAEVFINIPMADGVESLNVAAAGAILIYETARQRGFHFTNSKPKEQL